MESKYQRNLNTIVAAANFNRAFRDIYKEFEKEIFLKINHTQHEHQSPDEISLDDRFSQPTYDLSAVYYMRVELTMEHVCDLRDTIFSQLFPAIQIASRENLELILRSIFKALAKEILYMDLIQYDDIKKINFKDMLLRSKDFMHGPQTEGVLAILNTLVTSRDKSLPELTNYVNKLVESRSGLWKIENLQDKEYQREIETQFVLSEVRLGK